MLEKVYYVIRKLLWNVELGILIYCKEKDVFLLR